MQALASRPGFLGYPAPSGSKPRTTGGRSSSAAMAAARPLEGAAGPLPLPIKVVGCGSCGLDYLASVAAYPKPDEKLRTETLEVQGGGNCANALTAAARLGLSPTIITKIGGDGLGDGIITELQQDGVDTSLLLRAEGHPSPFTYIIVDRAGGTRTCIHTPGAPMGPEEMTAGLIDAALSDAALVYFDGRLTEAAVLLARAARARGVPVLVEGERLRPGLESLLAEADYVVTSAHFPQEWTGEATIGDAMLEVARRLPRARVVVTTRGTRGSVLLRRATAGEQGSSTPESLDSVIQRLESLDSVIQRLEQQLAPAAAAGAPDCRSANGIELRRGGVAGSGAPLALGFTSGRDGAAAAQRAGAAAAAEAARNADAGNPSGYGGRPASAAVADAPLVAEVLVAPAAALAKESVVDTTGAGDSFIGSVIYGLVTGLPLPATLQLAAVVAACKCTALGARPGLPGRGQLKADLLGA